MTEWHLGTMSFTHPDWQGVVYPETLPAKKYLQHYSQYFNAVEIDSTFYGTPRKTTVDRWRQVTPPDFTISVKTPRTITHEMKLVNADGLMLDFVETMRELGKKLGAILIQFPPDFEAENFGLLENFLNRLPGGARYAVEFRHSSWAILPCLYGLHHYAQAGPSNCRISLHALDWTPQAVCGKKEASERHAPGAEVVVAADAARPGKC
jgi:uncharacterized protein YecE (DUF72 family)